MLQFFPTISALDVGQISRPLKQIDLFPSPVCHHVHLQKRGRTRLDDKNSHGGSTRGTRGDLRNATGNNGILSTYLASLNQCTREVSAVHTPTHHSMRRATLPLVAALVAAAAVPVAAQGGCQLLPVAPPGLATLRAGAGWGAIEEALSAVDAAVAAASAANQNMSIGVVAAYRGEVVHTTTAGAARYSPAGAAVPPDDRTVWRIGSVTKVFTALALLKKADTGDVSLDDKVRLHLPGFTLSDDITLRSLATQLSGMTREPPMPCQSDESRCNLTTDEILPELNKGPLLWSVNVRPSYSNLGFGLLGRALEPVYGKQYEAYVEEDICAVRRLIQKKLDLYFLSQNILP